jgi:hypothetical protein
VDEFWEPSAHSAPITSMELFKELGRDILVTGSEDGYLKAWEMKGKQIRCFLA